MTRLDEFDKNEWRDVCRLVMKRLGKPDFTEEEFEHFWAEFHAMKERRKLQ